MNTLSSPFWYIYFILILMHLGPSFICTRYFFLTFICSMFYRKFVFCKHLQVPFVSHNARKNNLSVIASHIRTFFSSAKNFQSDDTNPKKINAILKTDGPYVDFSVSLTSYFCIPEQGMKDFELLSRASLTIVKRMQSANKNSEEMVLFCFHWLIKWRQPTNIIFLVLLT